MDLSLPSRGRISAIATMAFNGFDLRNFKDLYDRRREDGDLKFMTPNGGPIGLSAHSVVINERLPFLLDTITKLSDNRYELEEYNNVATMVSWA